MLLSPMEPDGKFFVGDLEKFEFYSLLAFIPKRRKEKEVDKNGEEKRSTEKGSAEKDNGESTGIKRVEALP